MAIWIWCSDCEGRFEAKASSLKIEVLGDGAYRLTARCSNCSEKSMARIVPFRPNPPAAGSPFAQTVMEILQEEGCMTGESEPPGPARPRDTPFRPRLVK